MPKIQINIPDGEILKFELNLDSFTVGRAEGNDIEINDASMSGSHAELSKDGGNYRLVDLDSTNGTKVNGERVTEHFLSDGDQIQFGNVPASYTSEAKAKASAEQPSAPTTTGAAAGMSAAEQADAWAEDEQPLSTTSSSMSSSRSGLTTVANSGFGAKPKKKDPIAGVLFTLATFAILACVVAVLMAFQMRS